MPHLGDKLKSLLHIPSSSTSNTDNDFPESENDDSKSFKEADPAPRALDPYAHDTNIRADVKNARLEHESAEADASELIRQRLEDEATWEAPPPAPQNDLSSLARRPSLQAAAHPSQVKPNPTREGAPDFGGFRHVPESELPGPHIPEGGVPETTPRRVVPEHHEFHLQDTTTIPSAGDDLAI